MSNNIDAKYNTLGLFNYVGVQEDRELQFYNSYGITSTNIRDAENEFLGLFGYASGSVTDRWDGFLRSRGFTGSVDDMLVKFWELATASLDLNFVNNNYASSSLVNTPFKNKSFNDAITFSRGTNATYVDSLGNIAYAPSNLLTYSEQFDNAAWVKSNSATVSANTSIAPDGTTTADTMTSPAISGQIQQTFTGIAGVVYTTSMWIKRRTGTGQVSFRAVENSNTPITVTTEWQRFSFAVTSTSTTIRCGVFLAVAGDEVDVWGAQLNLDGLQPYNSTTVKNLLGYTQDFDNAAWTKSNSFIQTNLLTYSEQFDNAAWVKSNSSITQNVITAPDGALTADKLVEDTATSTHFCVQNATVVSGALYTFTCYIKAAERLFASIQLGGGGFGNQGVAVNLTTGASTAYNGATSSSVTSVGNGWWRISVTAPASGTSGAPLVLTNNTLNGQNYTGDGTSGIYLWGAQVVQGATAGDYEATTSTAKVVMYPAPDGSVTADKLVEDTATSPHNIYQTVSSAYGFYTLSIYAKAAERSVLRLTLSDLVAGAAEVDANLLAGTVSTPAGSTGSWTEISSQIELVANGWYRVSISARQGAGTAVRSFARLSNGLSISYTGDGTSGVYIWGAQLSDSASLDPYSYNFTTAPTAAAYYGPRFDYDPVTLACKGLLIEEQRTNLYTSSFITKTGGTNMTYSDGPVAPDASQLFVLGQETTDNGEHYFEDRNFTPTLSTTYAFSVYAKQGPGTRRLYMRIAAGNIGAVEFNLQTGLASAPSAAVSSAYMTPIGNGVYRCTGVWTATAATATVVRFQLLTALGQASYAGDGTSGIYLWGAQLEAGAFPTSYIPTTTAAVTRAADVAVIQGANFSNWYNQSEGTLYAEFVNGIQGSASATGQSPGVWAVADSSLGGTFNGYGVRMNASLSNTSAIQFTGRSGATTANAISAAIGFPAAGATYKTASAWNAGNIIFAISGVAGASATNTVASLLTVQNIFHIGTQTVGGAPPYALNGHIARIAYYPRRFSDTDLTRITK